MPLYNQTNGVNILLLENINPEAVRIFNKAGYTNIVSLKESLSEDRLMEAIRDVHVLGIRSKTHITPRVLAAAKNLLAIGCFCIGTDQVDLVSAMHNGVAVFNAPYSNTRSVAELVIGAAVMLMREVPAKNKMAHEKIWVKGVGNSHELRGKTIGIVGYGNIGSQVSILAEAMGMKVIFYDVQKKLPLGNASAADNLQTLLQKSDILSLHTPATALTRNLINNETLKDFKKGAILINYARGEIIDIAAVKEALESGILTGVAVDVFANEPAKDGDPFVCPLQGMPNVLLTPHIGGSTEEAQVNIGADVSDKLVQFIQTGTTLGSHSVPELSLPVLEKTHRILHIHRNVPGVLSAINSTLSAHGINILGQYLKTNEQIGYVVLDIAEDSHEFSRNAAEQLGNVKDTIKVRLLY